MSLTASRASASVERSSAKKSVSAAARIRSRSESSSLAGPMSSRVRMTRPYACERSEVMIVRVYPSVRPPYLSSTTGMISLVNASSARRWLVDGMNVVGSRPDGWWRDREGAKRALAERLAAFAEATGEPVAVVFDGRPFEVDARPVQVDFAERRGPNAADDAIA